MGLETLDSNFDLFFPQLELVLLGPQHHDRLVLAFLLVGGSSLLLFGGMFELLLGLRVPAPLSLDLGLGLLIEGDSVKVDESVGVLV